MGTFKEKSRLNSVAVIGNYLPRQCGIATFTTDLCNALSNELGSNCQVAAVAMDDLDSGYSYPQTVRFQLRDHWLPDYLNAADFLNVNQFDVVVLQHEFGIFGGKEGSHILRLIKNLSMPLITTLHTVLDTPSDEQRKIMLDIAEYSDKLVVMSKKAQEMLQEVYKIDLSQISVIHHGIPDVSFVDPCFYKDIFGIEDRNVLLSFGLLHPGKGIEFVLNALPKIIKKHPDVIYIILGATHPNILRESGDAYRQSLLQLTNRLDIKNNVQFKNQFVKLEELCEYIGAADIYITPYISEGQIVSGTLAYALGSGKAVISTPYWYAGEALAEGRGILVPFKNSDEIAREVNKLLSNSHERNAIRKKAYQFGRQMIWKEVARRYIAEAIEALELRESKPKNRYLGTHISESIDDLPTPKLNHLRALTDSTGILQHAYFTIPNRDHGYCTDDNARALIVTSLHYSLYKDEKSISLTETYLAFLFHAFNRKNGRFRNFMSYDREWLDDDDSEDSHGRALWGLGVAVKYAPYESIRNMATRLFMDGMSMAENLTYPRAWAYSLIGLHSYLEVYSGDAIARRLRNAIAKKLYRVFKDKTNPDWPWYENVLTYANARIAHALLLSGQFIPNKGMREKGLSLLKWLLKLQTASQGHLSIIGNGGWMELGGKRSHFDQQPIEAMSFVDACAEAYRSTGDDAWLKEARHCLNWFLGHNDLHVPLYDFKTGGCHDGLQPHGFNANQGAESTLSWLISILTMYEIMGQEAILKKKAGKK